MKTLKLEVGKTYRNRKGEEVKIVRKGDAAEYLYRGSNGELYYESGKWSHVTEEHPKDLIEEVPETSHTFGLVPGALTATRYTFDIPDGMKKVTVSQEGNRIVVEMIPTSGPKPGDVMINTFGHVYIFKKVIDDHNHEHYAWFGTKVRLSIGGTCLPGHPATPEEAKPLFDALKKASKRWNPETMQVEEIPEIDRIREWVEERLSYRYYTLEDLARAIEAYLIHREGGY